jgi:hypothetical protein
MRSAHDVFLDADTGIRDVRRFDAKQNAIEDTD